MRQRFKTDLNEYINAKRIQKGEKYPCLKKDHNLDPTPWKEKKDYIELMEDIKQIPIFNEKEVREDYYGKAFDFFQYWLPENKTDNLSDNRCNEFFNCLRHQRDFFVRSLNFEAGFREKAKIIDDFIKKESENFALKAKLSSSIEKRLRRELKGNKSLKNCAKWFDRVPKKEPHSEIEVRKFLKPWMKDGFPSANNLYRSSKARFYKKVYFEVLESCCNYFRGRYLEEDRKLRKRARELLNSKKPMEGEAFERTLHSRWLLNLNISHAICTYSREMQMTFNDFNMMPNNMFKTAMKSCLSEYRNFVRKKYARNANHTNVVKLQEKKLNLEKKINDFDCHRLNPRRYSTTTGTRILVDKGNPFLTYDEHLENTFRRNMTISQYIFRKFRERKAKVVTFCQMGKICKLSRRPICVVNRKRFCIRGSSLAPVFDILHKMFSKIEKRRQVPKNKQRYSRRRGSKKSETDSLPGASDFLKTVSVAPSGENKMDGHKRTKRKSFESDKYTALPFTENVMDGSNRQHRESEISSILYSRRKSSSNDPLKDIFDYKVRNFDGNNKTKSNIETSVYAGMLPNDPLFYQSELGTGYALHRYESEMNKFKEFYNAIDKSRSYTVGYASALFYWIRAYFEEYRRIKKHQPPLNYLFRKTYLPDPYLHFCPINKVPDLDWILLKLQDNERISETFSYGYLAPMKLEILKQSKSCFDSKAHYTQGLECFKCLRLFKPFREIPCSSCYPDYKGNKIYDCTSSKECLRIAETDNYQYQNSFDDNGNFEDICCGMIQNSSGVKPKNITNILLSTENYKKIFTKMFINNSDLVVIGNIHRTKEHIFKENVLTPIISASKQFFKRYFGEYLCLFTREQSAIGTLCNYRVVKRSKRHQSWSAFTDLIVDTLSEVDTELIKAREYVPFNIPVRMVEADSYSVYGYKGARHKYYNEKSEVNLTHEYTFLKYKNFNSSASVDNTLSEDDTLTELLVNIEMLVNEGYLDKSNGDDPIQERVLERLITQDADDSEWTIYENQKVEESLRSHQLTPSEISLVEYESDPLLTATSQPDNNDKLISRGRKVTLPDNGVTSFDPDVIVNNFRPLENPQIAVVSHVAVNPTYGVSPSESIPQITSPLYATSDSNVSPGLRASLVSREEEHAYQRLLSEGNRYRQTFTFQNYDQNSFTLKRRDTGFPRSLQSTFAAQLIESDDGREDSVPLTYNEVLRHNASKTDVQSAAGKETDYYESTYSFPPTQEQSAISLRESVCSFDYGEDGDLNCDLQQDIMKDIWFYDRSGKLQKHANRRKRLIEVNGDKRQPAECILITQSYYNELARYHSKNVIMHLVLNCWNAHQKEFFDRQERSINKASKLQKKKRAHLHRQKLKERVFWRNRKIVIDDDFREKIFLPTKRDTFHRDFFKNKYKSVQYWLHKTLVTPSTTKSGWFQEVQKKEEESVKKLEEEAKSEKSKNQPDILDAINKIREHNLKIYGTELNSYSNVWNSFWGDWKEGRYKDVYDPNLLCDRNNVDSDDESINADDFVLGFPSYSNHTSNISTDFEERFNNFMNNKKLSEDLLKELSNIVGSTDVTNNEY